MHKEIFLIRGTEDEAYSDFEKRTLDLTESLVTLKGVDKLKVTLTKEPPPKISVIPFKRKKVAAISICADSKIKIKQLIDFSGFSGSYSSEEAIPVSYIKDWDDKVETPGICLLTLFKQKNNLDYNTFIDRWHNSHTPLSLKIHPLWNYNRNVVRKREDNSESWDGIVEEQFKKSSDLLNPIVFFGNPLVMFYRMWLVYSDTKSFLDYKTIEPYYAREIHIKS